MPFKGMLIISKIHKCHLLCLPDQKNDQNTLRRIKMNYDLRGYRMICQIFVNLCKPNPGNACEKGLYICSFRKNHNIRWS